MSKLTRRRFIAIAAAAAGAPGAASAGVTSATWRGIALGAPAQMVLAGLTPAQAQPVFDAAQAEIDRLENIFSLFRPGSALARLNAAGVLENPPQELLEVLSLSAALNAATAGAFDPTVQPLWAAHATAAANGRQPDAHALATARSLIGWPGVAFDTDRVSFDRPGMGLTLNGIAQGYVADRVAAVMRRHGLRDVLVDMGEIHALGARPQGAPWRAGIVDPQGRLLARVGLSDRALATSAPGGTLVNPDAGLGHILDPRTGRPGGTWALVSVSADSAALADGLSTAFCLLDRPQMSAALARWPTARLETVQG